MEERRWRWSNVDGKVRCTSEDVVLPANVGQSGILSYVSSNPVPARVLDREIV
jgi:hypothetical protein